MNPTLSFDPPPALGALLLVAYFATLALLSLYGLHRYQMLYLYYRYRARLGGPAGNSGETPRVTVQLPVYNEVNVASRLIDAVCAFDYPRDRLEIQVLDDSNDETSAIVASTVARHACEGLDIRHIRRPHRRGYKAGALDEGLRQASGELIAVFDADFLPQPGFLRRLVPHFADPAVGMVQARWDHLNRDHSLLTRVQSMLLDGHFVIEHAARNASGRFFNFNGTAGVWRRSCIEQAGGWQHDTLTEDLDLSYRAQLAGWRFTYLPETTVPAEIPVEMDGFKSQQHRWAKGSVQTARKLLGRIMRSPLSPAVKLEAFVHLTANFAYPLMVLLAVLIVPAILLRSGTAPKWLLLIDGPLFLLSTASVSSFYICSQREIGRGFRRTLLLMPALMATGIGLSVNNARAVMEGMFSSGGEFIRTPKYHLGAGLEGAPRKRYAPGKSLSIVVEAAMALYLLAAIVLVTAGGRWVAIPFLALFCWGFGFTTIVSLVQRLRPAREAAAADPVAAGA